MEIEMTNKEKILQFIESETEANIKESRFDFDSCTAGVISKLLFLDRTNISRILNELYRENILIKISGKPIKYISKNIFAKNYPFSSIPKIIQKNEHIEDYISFHSEPGQTSFAKSFHMIGSHQDGSLYENINRILSMFYLPNDTFRIIILDGDSGTGKKFFLHQIYHRFQELTIIHKNTQIQYYEFIDFYAHAKEYIQQAISKNHTFISITYSNLKYNPAMFHRIIDLFELYYFNVNIKPVLAFICSDLTDKENLSAITPFYLKFPALKDRPVIEAIDLITLFVQNAAQKTSKTIKLTSTFIKTVYNISDNIQQLKTYIDFFISKAMLTANKRAIKTEIILDDNITADFFHYSTSENGKFESIQLPEVLIISPNLQYDNLKKTQNPIETNTLLSETKQKYSPTALQAFYYQYSHYKPSNIKRNLKTDTLYNGINKILYKTNLYFYPELIEFTTDRVLKIITNEFTQDIDTSEHIDRTETMSVTHKIIQYVESHHIALSSKQIHYIENTIYYSIYLTNGIQIPIVIVSKYSHLVKQYETLYNLYYKKHILHTFILPSNIDNETEMIETIFSTLIRYAKTQGILIFADKEIRSKLANRFFMYSNTLSHCMELSTFIMIQNSINQILDNNTNILNITPNLLVEQNKEKKLLQNESFSQYSVRNTDKNLLSINQLTPGINNFETNEILFTLLTKICRKLNIPIINSLVLDFLFHGNCILFELKNKLNFRPDEKKFYDDSQHYLISIIKDVIESMDTLEEYEFSDRDIYTLLQIFLRNKPDITS